MWNVLAGMLVFALFAASSITEASTQERNISRVSPPKWKSMIVRGNTIDGSTVLCTHLSSAHATFRLIFQNRVVEAADTIRGCWRVVGGTEVFAVEEAGLFTQIAIPDANESRRWRWERGWTLTKWLKTN
jgi:hypothetical protein